MVGAYIRKPTLEVVGTCAIANTLSSLVRRCAQKVSSREADNDERQHLRAFRLRGRARRDRQARRSEEDVRRREHHSGSTGTRRGRPLGSSRTSAGRRRSGVNGRSERERGWPLGRRPGAVDVNTDEVEKMTHAVDSSALNDDAGIEQSSMTWAPRGTPIGAAGAQHAVGAGPGLARSGGSGQRRRTRGREERAAPDSDQEGSPKRRSTQVEV